MDPSNPYRRQVQLLLRLLPIVAEHDCFALKGGTAINLFYNDLPRLSVDIDLVFLPLLDRNDSLAQIHNELEIIASKTQRLLPNSQCRFSGQSRLVFHYDNTQVKVEVNEVLRGTVHPVQIHSVSDATENEFGFAEMQLVSYEELYAGKICAALDRQHPRDLFDCQQLFAHSPALSSELLETFIVYLISHNRPIAELLNPRIADISIIFKQEFQDMTRSEITVQSLEATRLQLINAIQSGLSDRHKKFLTSFKSLDPQWHLLQLTNVDQLPAVRWKLKNIADMTPRKYQQALTKLEDTLKIDRAAQP